MRPSPNPNFRLSLRSKPLAAALALTVGLTVTFGLTARAVSRPDEPAPGPQLAHMVFFTLKERSPAARAKLAASCHKYLAGHEGATFFAVGTIAEDVVEPVSVRDFDVALHIVFESKAAGAKYLKDPLHVKFVEENKNSWSQVRVFDSYLTRP
jgi:hypothetical protein